MASPFFCEGLLDDLSLEALLGIHLLEPSVLVFEFLQSGHQGGVHAAEFAAPFVERRRTDAVLPAQFWNRATGLGLLVSTFVRSQVAAIFGTAILSLIPSVNFSGLLYPVSTLTGSSYWAGLGFPSSWFQLVSLGSFTKGLGAASFGAMYAALLGFALAYLAGAYCLLPKQEG